MGRQASHRRDVPGGSIAYGGAPGRSQDDGFRFTRNFRTEKTERELLELNHSLERRVAERTAALTTSEAQFRALVEHAPETIVVFNGDTGRFLFGNEQACIPCEVPDGKIADLTAADVSPLQEQTARAVNGQQRAIMPGEGEGAVQPRPLNDHFVFSYAKGW